MNNWEKLIGTLCFNIWHSTKGEFEKSGDFLDMEWPFLCALYVFHNWDNSILSKRFSIPQLLTEVDPALISVRDTLINNVPEFKDKIDYMTQSRKMESRMTIEPSKIFISIFTLDLVNSLKHMLDRMNPSDFFQSGLEILLLFTLELKEKDNGFYDLIEDIGSLDQEDADSILDQINLAYSE